MNPPIPLRLTRVVVADGHALVRTGLEAVFESEEDVTVVGRASHGEEAIAAVRDIRPDVLVIDAALPGVDGVEVTRRIAVDPDVAPTRVLLLSTSDDEDEVLRALRAGVAGFLLKDARPAQITDAVRGVASGGAMLAPSVARRLMVELAARPDLTRHRPEELEELTAREREVVALVAGGLSNDEIADQLVVSRATAKTHVSRALCKLRARDRAQLVRLAYETGLVVARAADRAPSSEPALIAA